MVDQDTKNQFFTHFTGEDTEQGEKLMRLLGYDFDSSWGVDNDNSSDSTIQLSTLMVYMMVQLNTPTRGATAILGPEIWKLFTFALQVKLLLSRVSYTLVI